MVLLAMPTGRANARPMTGSASSGDARYVRRSLTASPKLDLLGTQILTMRNYFFRSFATSSAVAAGAALPQALRI